MNDGAIVAAVVVSSAAFFIIIAIIAAILRNKSVTEQNAANAAQRSRGIASAPYDDGAAAQAAAREPAAAHDAGPAAAAALEKSGQAHGGAKPGGAAERTTSGLLVTTATGTKPGAMTGGSVLNATLNSALAAGPGADGMLEGSVRKGDVAVAPPPAKDVAMKHRTTDDTPATAPLTKVQFTLTFPDMEMDDFDDTKRDQFIQAVKFLTEAKADSVQVLGVSPGSVVVQVNAAFADAADAAAFARLLRAEPHRLASALSEGDRETPVRVTNVSTTAAGPPPPPDTAEVAALAASGALGASARAGSVMAGSSRSAAGSALASSAASSHAPPPRTQSEAERLAIAAAAKAEEERLRSLDWCWTEPASAAGAGGRAGALVALSGLSAAVSAPMTLFEEMKMYEEEMVYQEDVAMGTQRHKDLLSIRLRRRQEITSLNHDIPLVEKDMTDVRQQVEDETGGRGEERAQRALEEARVEVEQAQTALTTHMVEFEQVVDRLEGQIPEEAEQLQADLQATQGCIRVVARVRPGRADSHGNVTDDVCVSVFEGNSIQIAGMPTPFKYDSVFFTEASQKDVFDEVRSNIADVFTGLNAVIFAYGQTGSGKTHTLVGPADNPGIIRRMHREVFEYRSKLVGKLAAHRWPIRCSMTELYIDDFCDLLAGGIRLKKGEKGAAADVQFNTAHEQRRRLILQNLLSCTEKGMQTICYTRLLKFARDTKKERARQAAAKAQPSRRGAKPDDALKKLEAQASMFDQQGLLAAAKMGTFRLQAAQRDQQLWTPVEAPADTAEEMEAHFLKGDAYRHVRGTKMNGASSRSHLIFTIIVSNPNGQEGRMSLIDLAGSEKLKKSEVEGQGAAEAMAINKSLTCLGNVIEQLSLGSKMVPYRDHALTQYLKPWLSGTSKVTMFMNISPLADNKAETQGSLRFAQRAKAAKLQDEAKAGPIRRKIKAIQAEEKQLQEKHYELSQQTPHLEHNVAHAEEKVHDAEDRKKNAKKRLEKLINQERKLVEDLGDMQSRVKRLQSLRAMVMKKRWVVMQGCPIPEISEPALEAEVKLQGKEGEAAMDNFKMRKGTGRMWGTGQSFKSGRSMKMGGTMRRRASAGAGKLT